MPVLGNIRPSGKYLMEDFFYAGGLPGLLERIRDVLNVDCITVNGKTLGENIKGAGVYNDDVIRTRDNPVYPEGGVAVLRGNLCPDGAVIKPTAAEPHLLKHKGPPRSCSRITTTWPRASTTRSWGATKDSVLILRSAGPLGAPGMPEWGQLPIPKKLLEQGVRDMVRISDARNERHVLRRVCAACGA